MKRIFEKFEKNPISKCVFKNMLQKVLFKCSVLQLNISRGFAAEKNRDLFLLKFVRCNLTNFYDEQKIRYFFFFLQNLFGTSFEKSLSSFGISAFK